MEYLFVLISNTFDKTMKKKCKLLLCVLCVLCGQIEAANEIRAFTGCVDAFAVVREIDGDVWYVTGEVFEAWGTDARTALDYDIALTDESGDMFTGTFDTNIGAGYYYIITHDDADSTPADTDPAVWKDYGYWTGSAWQSNTLKTIEDKIDIIDTNVDDIETDTGTTIPATLTTIDGIVDDILAIVVDINDVNDTGVQSACDAALVALNLDHLMKTAVASNTDMTTEVTDGTVLSNIMTSDSDTSGYVVADDALEALSDTLVLIKYKTDLLTIHDDTVKTANDANNFIINSGKDANDAFTFHIIMVTDADDDNSELRWIADWYDDGGTDPNITVERPFSFTPASGDVVHIMGTGYGGWLYYILAGSGTDPIIYDFRPDPGPGGGGGGLLNPDDEDP